MPDAGEAARLTIHLDGAVLWHHRPAYAELVHRAHREGRLAGASVFHGFTGFGAERRIYRERPAHLAAKGPCAVVLVDEEDRLRCFLLSVQDVLEHTNAVAVLDRVLIHRTGARAVS
jgi:PII-like signaling protein